MTDQNEPKRGPWDAENAPKVEAPEEGGTAAPARAKQSLPYNLDELKSVPSVAALLADIHKGLGCTAVDKMAAMIITTALIDVAGHSIKNSRRKEGEIPYTIREFMEPIIARFETEIEEVKAEATMSPSISALMDLLSGRSRH